MVFVFDEAPEKGGSRLSDEKMNGNSGIFQRIAMPMPACALFLHRW